MKHIHRLTTSMVVLSFAAIMSTHATNTTLKKKTDLQSKSSQQETPAASPRVVSVDTIFVLQNSREGQALNAQIQQELNDFENLLRKTHEEIRKEQAELAQQSQVLNQAAFNDKQQKLVWASKGKEMDLNSKRAALAEEIQSRQESLRKKHIATIQDLIEKEGWLVAVEKNSPSVLGVAEATNVTTQVLKAVDQAFVDEQTKTNKSSKKM